MLFKKETIKNELPALDSKKADEIYELLKTKDINTMFLEDNIPTEYSEQVYKEIKKLESEMNSKVLGTFVTKEKVPAEYDEEGKEIKKEIPAEYFIIGTENKLIESMSSELLDIPKVVGDVRAWSDGKPEVIKTWTDYKSNLK